MNFKLLEKLKKWRSDVAEKEGVELYRVFPNKTIEAIATFRPKTKEDMLAVKGIREKKFEKYGMEILTLVNRNSDEIDEIVETSNDNNKKPYTVSAYLNLLNDELGKYKARIQGEISSLSIRDRYLFFSIKDTEDESALSCFMWKRNYDLCGVDIETGMEIIVDGFPEIYKPSGKLSVRVSTVELVGEGALKKAYDVLKKKLDKEGLFLPENKKPISEFPKNIGLITSQTGAVIHDFLNNLGKHGYKIKFVDSRVEGQIAVRDLLSAIDYFKNKNIDVLVIIRGGGSLESLQSFNNEILVRRISECDIPVICGIGHDKDAPLACMVADESVSTPTAVTKILDKTWDKALNDINLSEKEIMGNYEKMLLSIDRLDFFKKEIFYNYQEILRNAKFSLENLSNKLLNQFNIIFKKFEKLKQTLMNNIKNIDYRLRNMRKNIMVFSDSLLKNFKKLFEEKGNFLKNTEKQLKIADPVRQLKLGYSIVSSNKGIIKSIKQLAIGEGVDIRVSDGKIISKVKNIINK